MGHGVKGTWCQSPRPTFAKMPSTSEVGGISYFAIIYLLKIANCHRTYQQASYLSLDYFTSSFLPKPSSCVPDAQ